MKFGDWMISSVFCCEHARPPTADFVPGKGLRCNWFDMVSDFVARQKIQDVGKFNSYRTRDLVLAYMSALDAGDTETVVSV